MVASDEVGSSVPQDNFQIMVIKKRMAKVVTEDRNKARVEVDAVEISEYFLGSSQCDFPHKAAVGNRKKLQQTWLPQQVQLQIFRVSPVHA